MTLSRFVISLDLYDLKKIFLRNVDLTESFSVPNGLHLPVNEKDHKAASVTIDVFVIHIADIEVHRRGGPRLCQCITVVIRFEIHEFIRNNERLRRELIGLALGLYRHKPVRT